MWIKKGNEFVGSVGDRSVGTVIAMKARISDTIQGIILRKLWEYFEEGKVVLRWNPKEKQLETIPAVTDLLKSEYGSLDRAFKVLRNEFE